MDQSIQEFSKPASPPNSQPQQAEAMKNTSSGDGSGTAQDSPGNDLPFAALEATPTALAVLATEAPLAAVDLSLPAEPRIGARAPDFALQTLDGSSVHLSDMLGRPLLINYWATWCIPCQQELNILQKLHLEYQQKGFVIVSINAIDQDALDKVQNTVGEYGMTYPVLLDQGSQFSKMYQAIFFPTTFFVDANGVIRQIYLGDATEEEFRADIEKLLAGDF